MLLPLKCKVYTPAPLADAIVDFLAGDPNSVWLEPSTGGGAFVGALARRGVPRQQIKAIDLDPSPSRFDSCARTLRGVDFLAWAPTQEEKFDRVVANPPYVALPKRSGSLKVSALAILRALPGPNGTANYWAPFLLASLDLLRKGGCIGFVLPAAWDYADYALPVRERVLQSFSEVTVHRCLRPLFEEVSEGAVILLAKGYGSPCQRMRRFDHPSVEALLSTLESVAAESPSLPSAGTNFEIAQPDHTAFGSLFDIALGGVTGDARYFLLNEERRRSLGLPEEACIPVVSRARQLDRAIIGRTEWKRLKDAGERVWLFWPEDGAIGQVPVKGYLELPAEQGGCNRKGFKVSSRKPWYQVPLPKNVDGFLSGMTGRGPWISWRTMKSLSATNTIYVVSCKLPLSRDERCAWSISLLTTQARRMGQKIARHYADGLVKFEPGDLKRIGLSKPTTTRDATSEYERIVGMLLRGDARRAELSADAFLESGRNSRVPGPLTSGLSVNQKPYKSPRKGSELSGGG